MQTPSKWRLALALVAALLVTACASLGMPEPRDFNDRASYAYDLATQAAATIGAMVEAGDLGADAGEAALDRVADYKAGIDVARRAHALNAADGEAKLAAMRALIDALLDELRGRLPDES